MRRTWLDEDGDSGCGRRFLWSQINDKRRRLQFALSLRRDDIAGVDKLLLLIEIIEFGGVDVDRLLGIAAR